MKRGKKKRLRTVDRAMANDSAIGINLKMNPSAAECFIK